QHRTLEWKANSALLLLCGFGGGSRRRFGSGLFRSGFFAIAADDLIRRWLGFGRGAIAVVIFSRAEDVADNSASVFAARLGVGGSLLAIGGTRDRAGWRLIGIAGIRLVFVSAEDVAEDAGGVFGEIFLDEGADGLIEAKLGGVDSPG